MDCLITFTRINFREKFSYFKKKIMKKKKKEKKIFLSLITFFCFYQILKHAKTYPFYVKLI